MGWRQRLDDAFSRALAHGREDRSIAPAAGSQEDKRLVDPPMDPGISPGESRTDSGGGSSHGHGGHSDHGGGHGDHGGHMDHGDHWGGW